MPATTRVVQIEPAPMPTLHRIHAGRRSAPRVASAVATLPATSSDVGNARRHQRDHVEHALRMAVRGVDDQDVDAGQRPAPRRAPNVSLADADRRAARAAGRARPSQALGYFDRFLDVLDGDQPLQPEVAIDDEQLLDLVLVQDLARGVERRADRAR